MSTVAGGAAGGIAGTLDAPGRRGDPEPVATSRCHHRICRREGRACELQQGAVEGGEPERHSRRARVPWLGRDRWFCGLSQRAGGQARYRLRRRAQRRSWNPSAESRSVVPPDRGKSRISSRFSPPRVLLPSPGPNMSSRPEPVTGGSTPSASSSSSPAACTTPRPSWRLERARDRLRWLPGAATPPDRLPCFSPVLEAVSQS